MASGNRWWGQRAAKRWVRLGTFAAVGLSLAIFLHAVEARCEDDTTLRVVVKEAADDSPIFQAHLTLQFKIHQKYKLDKWISYSAKTDKKGQCIFHHITKGSIRLMVTADGHQSFGKTYDMQEDDPVIEVKLRKPQPQI